jgi:hypothetical protein
VPLLPITWFVPNQFNVVGFIDCNQVRTCRPGAGPAQGPNGQPRRRHQAALLQESFYNGWARGHGIKFETFDGPNGLTLQAFGPASMRQNDLWVVSRSGLNNDLARVQAAIVPAHAQKVVYGDSIYVWMTHVRSRHGDGGTPQQLSEDRALSSCREAIEHNYGEADQLFPYMSYKPNLKVASNQPLGDIYFTKLLFRNLYVCLYGNKTSARFKTERPYMEDYMV